MIFSTSSVGYRSEHQHAQKNFGKSGLIKTSRFGQDPVFSPRHTDKGQRSPTYLASSYTRCNMVFAIDRISSRSLACTVYTVTHATVGFVRAATLQVASPQGFGPVSGTATTASRAPLSTSDVRGVTSCAFPGVLLVSERPKVNGT